MPNQADYFDLCQALSETISQAYRDVSDMRVLGVRKAETRGDYRAALKARILTLRADKSIPATLVPKVAEGCADVNKAFVAAEIAEAEWEAARETVMLRKREADILREQINREWYTPKEVNV